MTATLYGMVTVRSSSRYTRLALDSFFAHTKLGSDDEVVLIDNDGHWMDHWEVGSGDQRYSLGVNNVPRNTSTNINQLISLANAAEKHLVFLSNDVVFTDGWMDPMAMDDRTLTVPSCNQTYTGGIPPSLTLEDFPRVEPLLHRLASLHRNGNFIPYERLLMPTYVCRIPRPVYQRVGLFDEEFNVGGEDVDYRIRLLQLGFDIKYCQSYLLHFNGCSSWNGAETAHETRARDAKYQAYFCSKWGKDLTNLCLAGGDPSDLLHRNPDIHRMLQSHKYNEAILEVLRCTYSAW